jgi:hypothetical protein
MLARQQHLDPLLVQHCRHELRSNLTGDQPLAVLVNTVTSHTAASSDNPTNRRNNRL